MRSHTANLLFVTGALMCFASMYAGKITPALVALACVMAGLYLSSHRRVF